MTKPVFKRSSGKKDDFYDICRVEVLAEIRVVD